MMFKHCSILPRVCEMTAEIKAGHLWWVISQYPSSCDPVRWGKSAAGTMLRREGFERVLFAQHSPARTFFERLRAHAVYIKPLFSRNASQPKCGLRLWGWIPCWCVQDGGEPVPQAALFHPWVATGALLLPVTSVLDPSGGARSGGLWPQWGQKKYNHFLQGRNSFCALTSQIITTTLMTDRIYACRPSHLFFVLKITSKKFAGSPIQVDVGLSCCQHHWDFFFFSDVEDPKMFPLLQGNFSSQRA